MVHALRLLRSAPRPTGAAVRSWRRRLFSAGAAAEPFPLASGAIPVPPVQVAYTAEEIDRCVAASFAATPLFVGFDTEYRPTFQKDAPVRRTALVQLASADACVLAHVYALERLPPRLSALLEDPSVLKVGTGVISDLDKLAADFAVQPASFVDLAVIARLFKYERVGMKTMSAHFGASVVKSRSTQLSNWENAPLRDDQVSYAAEDAALGLWLLDKLHAGHGAGTPLRDWAALFRDARSVEEMAARPVATHGPLRGALAAFAARVAAAEAALRAGKLDKRAEAALQAGLTDARLALGSLSNLAAARGQSLVWTEVICNINGRAVVEATCRLAGVSLARARGPNKANARREAAFTALQRLAGQPSEDDAEPLVP